MFSNTLIYYTNVFLPAELETELKFFIDEETLRFHDVVADEALQRAQRGEIDVEDIIKRYERHFKEVYSTVL